MQTRKEMKLIVFEGCDGVGKSTHAASLAGALKASGFRVIHNKEPFGSPNFQNAQAMLKVNINSQKLTAKAQAILYLASRIDHIDYLQDIKNKGQTDFVIVERLHLSTYMYQCVGLGLDGEIFQEIEKLVGANVVPDLTFVLDLEYDIAKQRMRSDDYYETMGQDFYERVRKAFKDYPHQGRALFMNTARNFADGRDWIFRAMQDEFDITIKDKTNVKD